jgi:CheY-like chemotaxis protein
MRTSIERGTVGSPPVVGWDSRPACADCQQRRRIVLCVDDDPVVLCLERFLLEAAGFAVLTACDYEEALGAFKSGEPDVVVLDYAIRGTTGSALAVQMRRLRNDVPLILYSGSGEIPAKDCLLFDRILLKGTAAHSLIPVLREMFAPEDCTGSLRGDSAGGPGPEGMDHSQEPCLPI